MTLTLAFEGLNYRLQLQLSSSKTKKKKSMLMVREGLFKFNGIFFCTLYFRLDDDDGRFLRINCFLICYALIECNFPLG